LAIFFAPEKAAEIMAPLHAGRERAGKSMADFDVVPTVPVVIGDDVNACADHVRAYTALYLGGMGSREKNFYNQLACRMGFEAAAIEVQDKYMAKDYQGAAAAVPMEFIDATSLIGPAGRIQERLHAYADAGVTTLTVATYAGTLDDRITTVRTMVEVLERSGLAT
jgi:alkanesulfonate monooxygenase SsuD/methylene tetrahydromethanopterin reductase-like flavin-dependent oxidoreductase (luciferase family)